MLAQLFTMFPESIWKTGDSSCLTDDLSSYSQGLLSHLFKLFFRIWFYSFYLVLLFSLSDAGDGTQSRCPLSQPALELSPLPHLTVWGFVYSSGALSESFFQCAIPAVHSSWSKIFPLLQSLVGFGFHITYPSDLILKLLRVCCWVYWCTTERTVYFPCLTSISQIFMFCWWSSFLRQGLV